MKISVDVSVSEVMKMVNEIQLNPGRIFDMMREDVATGSGLYLSGVMRAELSEYLGREPYERSGDAQTNHRNGSYKRNFTMKGIGPVEVEVPRDRKGEFKSQVLPRYKRYEDVIRQELCMMYLSGVSTRNLSMISERLIGRKISHGEISNVNKQLVDAVEQWRERSLSTERIKYLFVDGVNFNMRIAGSVEKVPVLVAIGVTETGHRLVLGMQSGDKESAGSWREFFKDLKRRGLDGGKVTLGIMDGLPGLEKVFKEEFPGAKVQRCQVHVARNVLAKVPRKLKKQVADDMRSIFYASDRNKAMEFFKAFKEKWKGELPSAVKCLENTIYSCLAYLDFPEQEHISLRTTNIIERLNKEFKRRTKPMEIVAGELACYTLLAFISLKMEMHWRKTPIGKVQKNLPFFKNMELNNFTQNS